MATEQFFPSEFNLGTRTSVIASPYQFLLTGEDNLRLNVWTSAAKIPVTLTVRSLDPDGTVQVGTYSTAAGTPPFITKTVLDVTMAAGYILNLSIVVGVQQSGVPALCYVTLQLVRGLGAAATVIGQLLADYAFPGQAVCWPGSAIRAPWEGPGYPFSQTSLVVPLTETAFPVPPLTIWQIESASAQLVCSAVVGSRFPILKTTSGEFLAAPSGHLAAGATGTFIWYNADVIALDSAGIFWQRMAITPPLRANDGITTQTLGLDAADRWSALSVSGRFWLDPNS